MNEPTDPVVMTKRLLLGWCIALWILVLIFGAVAIWIDGNAINATTGCGVMAFISSILYGVAYREERRP